MYILQTKSTTCPFPQKSSPEGLLFASSVLIHEPVPLYFKAPYIQSL